MEFYIYDLILLAIFCLAVGIFLFKNRKNLKREMRLIYLYKTKVGLNFINTVGKKYKKTLGVLKYISISTGYILMAGILFLIGRSAYLYIRYPKEILSVVKAPPIAPVIPYFPKLFGMESFFPPFYFIYFILALGVVAIVHEFSHGIFARFYNVKIKSTGILFLGPILGAFVEQDEKQMSKLKKSEQMSILSAGVFANILAAILFLLIWAGLFYATFIPSGATFNSYALVPVKTDSISMIDGIDVAGFSSEDMAKIIKQDNLSDDLILSSGDDSMKFIKIVSENENYFMTAELLKQKLEQNTTYVLLYGDYPAINSGMKGAIVSIDENEIRDYNKLGKIMENYNPGDKIKIKTIFEGNELEYNLVLGESYIEEGKPMIGIGNLNTKESIAENLAFFKNPFTEYKTRSDFLLFIYYLAFWIFFINLLVGLFNMLPVPILDGGMFFYLSILGITKKEKTAQIIYKSVGMAILFMFMLMMLRWFIGII